MTDRFHTLTVVLDRDYREDDAQAILDAIRMVKGVIAVDGNVTDHHQYGAVELAKHELRRKVFDALK